MSSTYEKVYLSEKIPLLYSNNYSNNNHLYLNELQKKCLKSCINAYMPMPPKVWQNMHKSAV